MPVARNSVIADTRLDAGRRRAALNHPIDVLLRVRSSLAGLAAGRAKQRAIRIAADAGGCDIVVEDPFQAVMAGHLVFLAALFVEPYPAAPALGEVVAHLHFDDGVHAGDGVDHDADQRAVAQTPGQRVGRDGVQQRVPPRVVVVDLRRRLENSASNRPSGRSGQRCCHRMSSHQR
jgi:hypothetical protein